MDAILRGRKQRAKSVRKQANLNCPFSSTEYHANSRCPLLRTGGRLEFLPDDNISSSRYHPHNEPRPKEAVKRPGSTDSDASICPTGPIPRDPPSTGKSIELLPQRTQRHPP